MILGHRGRWVAWVLFAPLLACHRAPPPLACRTCVFVTNEGSGTLSVIDAESERVVATLPVGRRPRGVRASPDGKLLYVAVSGTPRVPPGAPAADAAADASADGIAVLDLERGGSRIRALTSG